MMQNDRMPSVALGIFVPADATYDSHHHWRNDAGQWRPRSASASAATATPTSLQGDPAVLRGLAAALVQAADLADAAASVISEGVAR